MNGVLGLPLSHAFFELHPSSFKIEMLCSLHPVELNRIFASFQTDSTYFRHDRLSYNEFLD